MALRAPLIFFFGGGGNLLSQNLVGHTSGDTSFVCGQMVDIFLSRITELFFN